MTNFPNKSELENELYVSFKNRTRHYTNKINYNEAQEKQSLKDYLALLYTSHELPMDYADESPVMRNTDYEQALRFAFPDPDKEKSHRDTVSDPSDETAPEGKGFHGYYIAKRSYNGFQETMRQKQMMTLYAQYSKMLGLSDKYDSPSKYYDNIVNRDPIKDGNDALKIKMFSCHGSQFVDSLLKIGRNQTTQLYITPNQSKTRRCRKEDIFAYSNIVKDIDAHNIAPQNITIDEFNRQCESLADELLRFLPEELRPNFIVYTGRGLQMWWSIQTASYKTRKLYDIVSKTLNYYIESFLYEEDDFAEMFSFDSSVDTNPLHLVRMPGSYNIKGGQYSSVRIVDVEHRKSLADYHDAIQHLGQKDPMIWIYCAGKKDIFNDQFQDAFDPKTPFRKKKPAVVKKLIHSKKNTNKEEAKAPYYNLHCWRCDLIRYIAKNRESCKGNREKMLFSFMNSAIQYMNHEEAEDALFQLNTTFTNPLKQNEVEHVAKEFCARAWKPYGHVTQPVWLNYIGATAEEVNKFQQERTASIQYRKMMKRRSNGKFEARQKRNYEILSMHKQGTKIKELAQKFGLCVRSIKYILANTKETIIDRFKEMNPLAIKQTKNVIDKINQDAQTINQMDVQQSDIKGQPRPVIRTKEQHRMDDILCAAGI